MSTDTNAVLTRVLNARNSLPASGRYLGDPSIVDRLEWVHDGRGHVLTYTPPATDNFSAEPNDEDTAGESDVPAFVLSAIACIDHDDFWLTADGGYHAATLVCRELLDVKPSCALATPGLEPVRSDFATVLQNLRQITEKCTTPGYASGKSFFTGDFPNTTRFKLRHQLFESSSKQPFHPLMSVVPPDPYSFERWPLTRERNRAELLTLKNTYRIVPIPAYDPAGDLLKPSTYRRYLQGALVEIHFTLTHWGIAGVKRDVYGGEIEKIRVLEPPVGSSSPDRKRKIPLRLESDGGPNKKRATA
ncbi:hypothetical protein PISMIDRAFT_90711 [Pisolithus microcarpus 441]|uniref:Uncharacterized protein n=1 Tax=Pisolithus microcarpus 441 TaxID=765257 RepID=A0A0C9ZGF4_9AGAM|nr:hypothetical protein PISMIDRAFT_90711 [Pisolithus microcarpus 441]